MPLDFCLEGVHVPLQIRQRSGIALVEFPEPGRKPAAGVVQNFVHRLAKAGEPLVLDDQSPDFAVVQRRISFQREFVQILACGAHGILSLRLPVRHPNSREEHRVRRNTLRRRRVPPRKPFCARSLPRTRVRDVPNPVFGPRKTGNQQFGGDQFTDLFQGFPSLLDGDFRLLAVAGFPDGPTRTIRTSDNPADGLTYGAHARKLQAYPDIFRYLGKFFTPFTNLHLHPFFALKEPLV